MGGPFKLSFVGILVKNVPEIPGSKKRKGKKIPNTGFCHNITDKTRTENEAPDSKIAKQFNMAQMPRQLDLWL